MRVRWRLAIPLIQLGLGIGLWFFIPVQFHRRMLAFMHLSPQQMAGRSLALTPEAFARYYPPPAGRFLYAMNYPAYVASNGVEDAIRWRETPIYRFSVGSYTYIIGASQTAFFLGICLLWFWVGSRVDQWRPSRRWVRASVPTGH